MKKSELIAQTVTCLDEVERIRYLDDAMDFQLEDMYDSILAAAAALQVLRYYSVHEKFLRDLRKI